MRGKGATLSAGESVEPEEVVAFWREAGREKWFKKDADFDRAIAERFGDLHAEIAAGRKADWAKTAEGALALILVLDQFSRNMFRDSPKAFAQDAMASEFARAATAAGFDRAVEPMLAHFFHMPFMHSERIADQERSVLHFHAIGSDEGLKFAHIHEQAIRRFGRFPHRNPILGRHMTPAEQAYLGDGGFVG
jgi:uncharacterized protein (DUF924 family)